MGACRLSRRAGTAKLPASTVADTAGAEQEVLTAHAEGPGESDWRVVDLWSDEGTPWAARVVWSGGGGALRAVKLDVPACARLCVHATTVQVFGGNLSGTADVNARAAIADGRCEAQNQFTTRGSVAQAASPSTVDTTPPPWAAFVRLELSDATLLPSAALALRDVNGTPRGQYAADQQPHPGAPVGDAATVRVSLPAGTFAWRLVFLLHL